MSTMMPIIVSCNGSKCSYNANLTCNATAVTIGEKRKAVCDTFHHSRRKISFAEPITFVGACKMENCKFNRNLKCSAYSGVSLIQMSDPDNVICNTFREK